VNEEIKLIAVNMTFCSDLLSFLLNFRKQSGIHISTLSTYNAFRAKLF